MQVKGCLRLLLLPQVGQLYNRCNSLYPDRRKLVEKSPTHHKQDLIICSVYLYKPISKVPLDNSTILVLWSQQVFHSTKSDKYLFLSPSFPLFLPSTPCSLHPHPDTHATIFTKPYWVNPSRWHYFPNPMLNIKNVIKPSGCAILCNLYMRC